MKRSLAVVPAAVAGMLVFSAVAALAYSGNNQVNMSGSSCRSKGPAWETTFSHDAGETRVQASSGVHRVFCPLVRRGTSLYGGKEGGVVPVPPAGTEKKVSFTAVGVRATDASATTSVRCSIFASRLSDGAAFWGPTKYLCSTTSQGCSSVANSYTGTNSMVLAPSSALSGMETVNFGVVCDLGPNATIRYLSTTITPN